MEQLPADEFPRVTNDQTALLGRLTDASAHTNPPEQAGTQKPVAQETEASPQRPRKRASGAFDVVI